MVKNSEKLLKSFFEKFSRKKSQNFFDLFFKNILQNKIKSLYLQYGVAVRVIRTSQSWSCLLLWCNLARCSHLWKSEHFFCILTSSRIGYLPQRVIGVVRWNLFNSNKYSSSSMGHLRRQEISHAASLFFIWIK